MTRVQPSSRNGLIPVFPELSTPAHIVNQVVAAAAMILSAQFAGALAFFAQRHLTRRVRTPAEPTLPVLSVALLILASAALVAWPWFATLVNPAGVRALPAAWTVGFVLSGWAVPAGWRLFDTRYWVNTEYKPRHAQVNA